MENVFGENGMRVRVCDRTSSVECSGLLGSCGVTQVAAVTRGRTTPFAPPRTPLVVRHYVRIVWSSWTYATIFSRETINKFMGRVNVWPTNTCQKLIYLLIYIHVSEWPLKYFNSCRYFLKSVLRFVGIQILRFHLK